MYPNPYEQNPYDQRQAGSGGNTNPPQNPPQNPPSGPNPYGPSYPQTAYGGGQYAPAPPPPPSNPQWDSTVRADDPSQYPAVPTNPNQYPQTAPAQYAQPGANQYAAPTVPNQFAPNQFPPNQFTPTPAPANQYQGGTFSPPPTPTKRPSSNMRLILIGLAAVLIIGGALATFFAVSAHNTQVANDNATATAQVNATNTAVANTQATGTAVAQANATATAQVQATATAIASTYPFSATVKLDDPLSDNSKGESWKTGGACSFTGGAYHVNITTSAYDTCPAMNTTYTDFTYQVSMQINQGDYGGITLRGNDASSHFYSFIFDDQGNYYIFLYTASTNPVTLAHDFTSAIQTGAGVTNTIGVVAKGDSLDLYVNNQEVTKVTSGALTSGQIGVIAYDTGNNTDVSFSNVKVWDLTQN